MILREFKTQDRKHPVLYTRSLGFELTRELRASLEKDPRTFLFTESNTSKPYTHSALAMYARRTLQKLFGKPCTLTLLRHSYISHMLAYGQLTIREPRAAGCRDVSFACDASTVSVDRAETQQDRLLGRVSQRAECAMKQQDATGRATHSQRILDSALKLENNASDLIDAAALL